MNSAPRPTGQPMRPLTGTTASNVIDFSLSTEETPAPAPAPAPAPSTTATTTQNPTAPAGIKGMIPPGNAKAKVPTLKGPWTKEEDDVVVKLVSDFGPKRWSLIASHLPGRTGKQCRERWHNQLDPVIKKDAWTEEEDRVLIEAHKKMGNRWVEISRMLEGRTDNAIKNRWNSTMRRRLQGLSDDEGDKENGSAADCRSPAQKKGRADKPVAKASSSSSSSSARKGPTDCKAETLSDFGSSRRRNMMNSSSRGHSSSGLSDTGADVLTTGGHGRSMLSPMSRVRFDVPDVSASGHHSFLSPGTDKDSFMPPGLSGEDADILAGGMSGMRTGATPTMMTFSPSEFLLTSPNGSSMMPTSAEAHRALASMFTPPSSRRSLNQTLNSSFTPGSAFSNNMTLTMSAFGKPPVCPSSNKRKRSPTAAASGPLNIPSVQKAATLTPFSRAFTDSLLSPGDESVCRLFH